MDANMDVSSSELPLAQLPHAGGIPQNYGMFPVDLDDVEPDDDHGPSGQTAPMMSNSSVAIAYLAQGSFLSFIPEFALSDSEEMVIYVETVFEAESSSSTTRTVLRPVLVSPSIGCCGSLPSASFLRRTRCLSHRILKYPNCFSSSNAFELEVGYMTTSGRGSGMELVALKCRSLRHWSGPLKMGREYFYQQSLSL